MGVEDLTAILKEEQRKADAANSSVRALPKGAKIEEDCVVCLDSVPEVCILPCKHCCMCSNCINSLITKHQKTKDTPRPTCPLCREPIKEHVSMEPTKVPKVTTNGQRKRDAIKLVMDEAQRMLDAIEESGTRVKFLSPVHKCRWDSLYHTARALLEQVKWQAPAGRALMRFTLVLICAGDEQVWKFAFPVFSAYFQSVVPKTEEQLQGHEPMLQVALGDIRAMMQKHAKDTLEADIAADTKKRAVVIFNQTEEACNGALLRLIQRRKQQGK